MKVQILQNYEQISKWAASYIQDTIQSNIKKPVVLGLPTGATIEGTYKYLVELHKQNKVSFKNTITFNMDEYYGVAPSDPNSYAYFMHKHLFKHIDIPSKHIHLLDGLTKDAATHVREYEDAIKQHGGIDLFTCGLGENAHIAFNEPFSSFQSLTHLQELAQDTKEVNARFFNNDINKVPHYALTVGIQTILNAKKLLVIVSGNKKASALQKVIEGEVSYAYPASILQQHSNVQIVCDEDASEQLQDSSYARFEDIDTK